MVFALVDMWLLLGDALTPHFAPLSTSQLKLVTIYVNRANSSKGPEVVKPPVVYDRLPLTDVTR